MNGDRFVAIASDATAEGHIPIPQAPAQAATRRRALSLLAASIVGAATGASLGIPHAGARAQTTATPTPDAAAPVVLVHGSFLGGWCWDEVVPLLTAAGHQVSAPDLPGHGADETPMVEITLRAYVDRVLESVDAAPAPVVLVGHSMAGVVISQVAEERPDKIKALVYLCAYLLHDGASMLDAALSDSDSLLAPKFQANETAGVGTIPPAAFAALFFHDCPAGTAERAMPRVRPEPLAPLATPIAVTEERFGRVPRYYVETLIDRVVSPSLQRRMQTDVPGSIVTAMATGHAPFFARPGELASLLSLL